MDSPSYEYTEQNDFTPPEDFQHPDLERVWSAIVKFGNPPQGFTVEEYWAVCWERAGGTLHDLTQGHLERMGIGLEVRVECTTSNIRSLFRRDLWKALDIDDVTVTRNPDNNEEVGGEG